ncbi:neuropilin-1 isoform X2 [Folsomia candida]|uniref:Neuropilin-2 n=1 Tax=Folsomia candida TaxID=158441 RepID=A0A226E684_FOLCA|nr:neuropilin-1 isoform X2 [Folsomia candida]OXA52467.1 Neuropilin-2 [Folsomia candida]
MLQKYMLMLLSTPFILTVVIGSDGIFPPSCHKSFPQPEGLITSPGYPEKYPASVICKYDILRHEDSCGVRVTFEDFELENWDKDGFCKTDWLSVDSCVPEGGNRFCGKISPTTYEYAFQNEAEYFRFVFRSDNSTQMKGFQIRYKLLSDCRHGLYWIPPISIIPDVVPFETQCFTQVTESKGTINTPFFPRHYPNNMDCVYEFLRESPFVCGIRMRVLTFDLEESIDTDLGGACSDFFHLVGGCGFMCGSVRFIWTAKYQPGASSMKFHFHSDEERTRTGFQIAFEQIYSCY